ISVSVGVAVGVSVGVLVAVSVGVSVGDGVAVGAPALSQSAGASLRNGAKVMPVSTESPLPLPAPEGPEGSPHQLFDTSTERSLLWRTSGSGPELSTMQLPVTVRL